jgi:hypothetical protein
MKKNVFFIVLAFVLQIFNMDVFCQQQINASEINLIKAFAVQYIGKISIDSVSPTLYDLAIRARSNMKFSAGDKNIISFISPGGELQMEGRLTQPFSLYFPTKTSGGGDNTNKIISANNLSLAGGDRRQDSRANLFLSANGNVGIGTADPSAKLHVNGNLRLDNGALSIKDNKDINLDISWVWFVNKQDTLYYKKIMTTTNNGISFGVNNKYVMDIEPNNGKGYVMIFKDGSGLHPTKISSYNKNKYALFVEEGILSEDYAIGPQSSWADHVFKVDYKLQTLNEVENYIKTNNRLPDMPSATDVKENGYTLHDMNVKLLQKVEELTLYSIEQNKKIEELEGIAKSYQTLLERLDAMESKINQ